MDTHYLLFLCAETLPYGLSDTGHAGYAQLRLWLLVHALERALRLQPNLRDGHLLEIAKRMVSAGEIQDKWKSFFDQFVVPPTSFHLFNHRVIAHAKMMKSADIPDFAPGSKTLRDRLQDMVSIAHYHEDILEWPGGSRDLEGVRDLLEQEQNPDNLVGQTLSLLEHSDDESAVPDADVFPYPTEEEKEDEEDEWVRVVVDARQSYFQQKRSANLCIRLSSEQSQILPWSWEHPNQQELSWLKNWLARQARADDKGLQMLALLMRLALASGRSLWRVQQFSIQDEPGEEWRLSLNHQALLRLPPARDSAWTPHSDHEREWLRPLSNVNRIPLTEFEVDFLEEHLQTVPGARKLEDLWNSDWGQSARSLFYEHCRGPFQRMTPGMLGHVLRHQIRDRHGNPILADMVSSHPLSSLPGAYAYAAWGEAQVEQALDPEGAEHKVGFPEPIAAGSRLQILEPRLVSSIEKAVRRMQAPTTPERWFEAHNRHAACLAVALWAATGMRPIRDPLESFDQIDAQHHVMVMDDKSRQTSNRTRLVPVPRKLSDHLFGPYRRYLGELAEHLSLILPELSGQIRSLIDSSQPRMPPLFFLNDQGWESVSPERIEAMGLFEWPLPMRLFRHRLNTHLHQAGLDPEIILGLFAHANGALSYGPYSPRCLAEDLEKARPFMEAAWESLAFEFTLPALSDLQHPSASPTPTKAGSTAVHWGRAHRRARRKKRLREAIEGANRTILELLPRFLDDADWLLPEEREAMSAAKCQSRIEKALIALEPEQVDVIAQRLLFNGREMPRSNGHLRYAHFEKLAERAWRRHGKPVRFGHRYVPFSEEATPFTFEAPTAPARYRGILQAWHGLLNECSPDRIGKADCLRLAVLSLCLDHRITAREVLTDLLERQKYRIVRWKGKHYLEYSPTMNEENRFQDIPVVRWPLLHKTAGFLDRGWDRLDAKSREVGSRLQAFLEAQDLSLESGARTPLMDVIVCHLAPVVRQCNALQFPVLLANHLDGKFLSASLSWMDLVRLGKGAVLEFDEDGKPAGTTDGFLEPDVRSRRSQTGEPAPVRSDARDLVDSGEQATPPLEEIQAIGLESKPTREETAEERDALVEGAAFIKTMREALAAWRRLKAGDRKNRRERQVVVRALKSVIRTQAPEVASALRLLGQWTIHLLETQYKEAGGRKRWRSVENTVRGYFNLLASRFLEAGADVDLYDLDSEEITEFYTDVLQCRPIRNQQYLLDRLQHFHDWASRLGIAEPDWSEIPGAAFHWSTAPRIVSETEYQEALTLLQKSTLDLPIFGQRAATLLILVHRFGLRPREARSLLLGDVAATDEGWQVLVQARGSRTLKRLMSRRQVPQLFELTRQEQQLMDAVIHHARARGGDDPMVPLFSDVRRLGLLDDSKPLVQAVNTVLRFVTGNQKTVLYDCRHGFAHRVCFALYDLQFPAWRTLGRDRHGKRRERDIKRILLGDSSESASVRAGWALARAMGHGHPGTVHRSYLHYFGDWAEQCVPLPKIKGRARIRHLIDLDQAQTRTLAGNREEFDLEMPSFRQATPAIVLEILSLMQKETAPKEAAQRLRLSPQWSARFEEDIVLIARHVSVPRKKRIPHEETSRLHALLAQSPFLKRVPPKTLSDVLTMTQARMDAWRTINVARFRGLEEWPLLIGRQQQLLLWKQDHFQLAQAFLQYLGMTREYYSLIASERVDETMADWARQAGFELVLPHQVPGHSNPIALDIAWMDAERIYRTERFCSLFFHPARNGIFSRRANLVMLFVAFAAAACMETDEHPIPPV